MASQQEEHRRKKRAERLARKAARGEAPGEESGEVGMLSSMRSGFKNIAGTGQAKQQGTGGKVLNIVVWVLLAAAIVFFLSKRLTG